MTDADYGYDMDTGNMRYHAEMAKLFEDEKRGDGRIPIRHELLSRIADELDRPRGGAETTNEYPTGSELKIATEYQVTNDNFHTFMDYIKSIWWCPNWGWTRDGGTYRISTGGWSGNEDVIGALMRNSVFWLMYWKQSRVGGHYIFSLSKGDWENDKWCEMPKGE